MKNNITYYSHNVNSDDHPKFKMLRVKYGWAGEGKFWALNNRIAQAENCELNLTKKYNKASLATDLSFTLEEFDVFLEYLENDCDLIVRENNHITTEIVREVLLRVMKERKRNKENYDKRVIQDVTKGKTQSKHVESEIKHVENIQRKVKESKVNKRNTLSAKKQQTVPEVKLFIDAWFIAYLKKFGEKYNVSGGKEGNLIKTLIGKYGYDKLKKLANAFWESDDPFIVNSDYGISVFYSQINKLNTSNRKSPNKGLAYG